MSAEYVECSLAAGFFEDEFYVTLGDSSAIVSEDDVKVDTPPSGVTPGSGRVRVYVIERNADRILIELPGQPVVGGLRTWIAPHATVAA